MSLMKGTFHSRERRLMILGLAVCVVLVSLMTFRHLCPPPVRPGTLTKRGCANRTAW